MGDSCRATTSIYALKTSRSRRRRLFPEQGHHSFHPEMAPMVTMSSSLHPSRTLPLKRRQQRWFYHAVASLAIVSAVLVVLSSSSSSTSWRSCSLEAAASSSIASGRTAILPMTHSRCQFARRRQPLLKAYSSTDEKTSSSLDLLSSMLGGEEDSPKDSPSASSTEVSSSPAVMSEEALEPLKMMLKAGESMDLDGLSKELSTLKDSKILSRWGSARDSLSPRSINVNQLQSAGIRNPEALAFGSTTDDLILLVVYVLVASVLAVGAAAVLPGQLGFFVPYLIGASSLVLLAVGSTNPGLLQGPKDAIGRLNPDCSKAWHSSDTYFIIIGQRYDRRLVRHEAAHFLAGYLLGVPVTEYNLNTPTGVSPHVEFGELMTPERMMEKVPRDELNVMGPLAMSGLAAEGMQYDDVKGGQADLLLLQLLMDRAEPRMTPAEQQDFTRWSVYKAIEMVKYNRRAHDALMEAMTEGKSVYDCILAIEKA
eukprot:jgi/Bigna1/90577/estExt_fgenesh1_pg.C_730096